MRPGCAIRRRSSGRSRSPWILLACHTPSLESAGRLRVVAFRGYSKQPTLDRTTAIRVRHVSQAVSVNDLARRFDVEEESQ